MGTRPLWFTFLACAALGCSSTGTRDFAELGFAKPAMPGGLPGGFTRLDGKALPDRPVVLRVPAGTRVIEYSCPDVVTVDAYPTVRATFLAGRSYVLECAANQPGVVMIRQGWPASARDATSGDGRR